MRLVNLSKFGVLVLALVAGCTNPVPTTGSLEVQVEAPSGVVPSVRAEGTNLNETISKTGTSSFSNLNPGTYTVSSTDVSVGGLSYRAGVRLDGASALPSATSQNAAVEAGKTTRVLVSYALTAPRLRLNLSVTPELSGFKPEVTLTKIGSAPVVLSASQVLDTLEAGSYSVAVSAAPATYVVSVSALTVNLEAGREQTLTVAYTRPVGRVQVQISAESGCTPSVALRQGSQTLQTLTASATVSDLVPGSYTLEAAASSGCAVAVQPSASFSITAGNQAGPITVAYTRLQGRLTVNLSGLASTPATLTLTPQSGAPISKTGTASVVFDALAMGTYTLSVRNEIQGGNMVDTLLIPTASQTSFTLSNTSPSAVTSVSYRARAGTGRIWVAGNGGFSNGGRGTTAIAEKNAAYSLGDTASVFESFIAPTASQAPFRIAFDRGGNLYIIYQYANSSSGSRIVRISEANLRDGRLGETASGNTVITQSAFTPSGAVGSEPADLAFDASGNLWVVNDYPGYLVCIAASRLTSSPSSISSYDQAIYGVGTNAYGTEPYNNKPYLIPHAIAFDNDGNLWFTAGGYGGVNGKLALLNRLNRSRVGCSGGDTNMTSIGVDISLNVSLVGTTFGEIVKPVTMVLEPGGQAIWVGDFGGQIPNSNNSLKRDANAALETVFRVRIDGLPANPTPTNTATLATDRVTHRFAVAAGTGTDKGLQQAFGLAFDSKGYMLIATNNNVEVMATDTHLAELSQVLTDRRGKLYRVDARNLSRFPTGAAGASITLNAANGERVWSVADEGVGLIGVATNLPNPTSLPNIYPAQ